MTSQNLEFEDAANYLRGIAGDLQSADLLYFYARYKQATQGFNNTDKPRFYDFKAKEKWNAWRSLGDMTPSQAMTEYVLHLEKLDPEWRTKESKSLEKGWVPMSVMQREEDGEIPDKDKTLLDWIKEGCVERVKSELKKADESTLNSLCGDEKMGSVHWAADRGHVDVMDLLLQHKANVNLQDGDGQTALHYAASCGHMNMAKFLVKSGANLNLCDNDGLRPIDVAYDEELKQWLSSSL